MRTPLRITLEHQEQFTLFLRAHELREMLTEQPCRIAPNAVEAVRADFLRCTRQLAREGINFWRTGDVA